ncbi:aminoglycoside phosphotransferase family protein [Promicromonospora sukumoe]|uniref:aminoglycoside phosphotransferase family protein n=1 Tax=Promicromonospora sukumoe TaxID=88382 RepID=UPI0018DEABED|nr:aminoglycoside phosphotransferase family protein [Promicromonospora sukumoe]
MLRARGTGAGDVARTLTALERLNYPYAPRYLGQAGDGRDRLSYIAGVTTTHPSERAEASYRLGGAMLRLLHDVTRGTPLAGDQECLTHRDPGPFNTIFRQGMPVAFIDWDTAGPGVALDDLAYLAWTWCIQAVGNVPVPDQARRLRQVRDGYGISSDVDLLDAVLRQQSRMFKLSESARQGADARMREIHMAARDWAAADRALVLDNVAVFRRALG